jgi:repressor LexA
MMKLHPTQKKLLQLLEKHQDEPLTVREIQDRLDLSSTSLVAHHIEQLEKKGWIKRNLYNPQDYHLLKSPEKPVVFLNLYGLAQCGPEGSVLDGNPIDRIGVSTKLIDFPAEEAFLVKARGDSMLPLINEGDIVMSRKTSTASNGKLIVCVNEGMALIKRYQESKGKVLLESENATQFPAIVASDDFRIEGEVRRVSSAVK